MMTQQLSASAMSTARPMAYFLPICDLMFNLISMIAYFCDVTFNIIALFILYTTNAYTQQWAYLGFIAMSLSSFVCQTLSLRWSLKSHFDNYKSQIDHSALHHQYHHHPHHSMNINSSTNHLTVHTQSSLLNDHTQNNNDYLNRHPSHNNNNNNTHDDNKHTTVSAIAHVRSHSYPYQGPYQATALYVPQQTNYATSIVQQHNQFERNNNSNFMQNQNLHYNNDVNSFYQPHKHSIGTVKSSTGVGDSCEFLPSSTTASTIGGTTTANLHNKHRQQCDINARIRSRYYLAILFESLVHCIQCGLLVRYIRLVLPVVDHSRVKRDARDLCVLRMCHAFCQSAPLLLIQLYIIWSRTSPEMLSSSSVTSVGLSLFSICWALASFTKYSRTRYLHHFVLTWPGVISQLLWRLGTVSSRVVALTFYAVHYGYWICLALTLHWASMFLWLLLPGNLLRDDDDKSVPRWKKFSIAMITAWVYCFCYINFEKHNSKQKMFLFYLLMFLENNLLLSVCLGFSPYLSWTRSISVLTVYLGFLVGITFMLLYYRQFHVNVINSDLSASDDSLDSIADHLSPAGKKIIGYKQSNNNNSNARNLSTSNNNYSLPPIATNHHQHHNQSYYSNNLPTSMQSNCTTTTTASTTASNNNKLPGVFSCRLNSAFSKIGPRTTSSETRWTFYETIVSPWTNQQENQNVSG